jgi:pimeloyl-ACP methyl ester carboxylesterase
MFAAAHQERTARLVLISPDGFASPGFDYDKKPDVPLMVRLLPYVLPRPLLRMSLEPAYADPKKLTEATVTRYRDMMLAPGDRTAMIARMRQVMLHDTDAAKYQGADLAVVGRTGRHDPVRQCRRLSARASACDLGALAEAGTCAVRGGARRIAQAFAGVSGGACLRTGKRFPSRARVSSWNRLRAMKC